MSEKKPVPTVAHQNGKICPVCGRPSYSRDGIHPQCAVQQADEPREQKLRQAKALEAERKSQARKHRPIVWNKKKCPKCGAMVHVRKTVCDCGYVMGGTKK